LFDITTHNIEQPHSRYRQHPSQHYCS